MSTGPRLSIRAVRSLGRALRHVPAWRGRHIGPQLRELVILHVSSVNGCPVCSVAHGLIGRAVGLDHDQIRAARGANNTWEALLPGAAWRRRALGLCDPES